MAVSRPLHIPLAGSRQRAPRAQAVAVLHRLGRTLGLRRPRVLRGERLSIPVHAPVLRTPRLTLRRHRLRSAADWYAIQSNPVVIEYMAWPLRDEAESRRHLRHRTRHTVLLQAGDFMALGVELDGRLIGDISLHLRTVSAESRSAEIGWVLNPDYSGHGYATEAADAMLDLAFGRLGATTVIAEIHPDNQRSVALARRLGFAVSATSDSTLTATPESQRRARAARAN